MPRRRTSELSRKLKRSAIEERRVVGVIEQELASRDSRTTSEGDNPGASRTGCTSGPRGPCPIYVPYAPRDPPRASRPQQIVAPDPASLARNAGVVARSLSMARRLPATREDCEHEDNTLQFAADDESDSSE